jgi:low affinity Fe/Cu permease
MRALQSFVGNPLMLCIGAICLAVGIMIPSLGYDGDFNAITVLLSLAIVVMSCLMASLLLKEQ